MSFRTGATDRYGTVSDTIGGILDDVGTNVLAG